MSLKDIMGSAYKQDMSLQEVEAFFEGNSKIVNLSNGGYVSKEKFDDINTKFQNLTNDTKDFEDIKNKYTALVEKQEKDGQLALINKHVKPEFAEYVHFQMKQGNLLGDKLEDNVKEYLKTNKQYGIVQERQPNRVVTTFANTEGQQFQNANAVINDAIRKSLGR